MSSRPKIVEPAAATAGERIAEGLALGPNEERYALAELLTPFSYAAPFAYRIKGPLDAARLADAIEWIVRRNEGLRSGFERNATGELAKFIEAEPAIGLKRFRRPGAGVDEIARLIHDETFDVADLTPVGMHRFLLIELGPLEHVFCFSLHHSCSDGFTVRRFTEDLFERYATGTDKPPAVQFRDVVPADWRETPAYAEALAYWRATLAEVDEVTGLADDRALPGDIAQQGAHLVRFDAATFAAAEAAAKRIGVSPFSYFYAACLVTLARATDQERVVTTFQSSGRRPFPGSETVVGAFSNALTLATRVDEAESIAVLARRLHGEIRQAQKHELCPYHHVVQATGVQARIGVNWFPQQQDLTLPGLDVSSADIADRQSDFDLNLRFLRFGDRLELAIWFKQARISRGRVEQLAERLQALVAELADDVERPLAALGRAATPVATAGPLPGPSVPFDVPGPAPRLAAGLVMAPNEERYILAETLTPYVYVTPWALTIRGALDVDRLQAAITATFERHEELRAGFERGPDGVYRKYIEAEATARLKRFDLRGRPRGDVDRLLHAEMFAKPALTPFSLHHFILIRTGEAEHVLGVNHHHATNDGQSMRLFNEELFARYGGATAFEPAVPFSRFIGEDWRSSSAYRESLGWWKARLSGVGDVAALADDRAVASGDATDQAVVRLAIPEAAVTAAQAGADVSGVTLFTWFYAASALALARLADQEVLTTTFQSNGRRHFPGSRDTIGPFSNALVLATRIDDAASTRALALQLQGEIRDAIEHERVPYHHVIQATGVHPRFGMNWFPRLPVLSAPGLEIDSADVSDRQSDYDLNLRFVRGERGLELIVFYKPHRVGAGRVQALAAQIAALAPALAADVDAPVGEVASAVGAAVDVLPDLDEPLTRGPEARISDAFVERAAAQPDAIAIEATGARLSYAALEARSRQVAGLLAQAGLRPGDRVAVIAERSPALVAAMLGAARAGVTFAALDSAYPEARLAALLAIARPAAVMADGGEDAWALAGRVAGAAGLPLLDSRDARHPADPAVLDRGDPDAPAYFLFTSGSTGAPKCVAVGHRPLAHFAAWQADRYGIGPGERVTMLSGLSHDPLMRDVFTTLSTGATLLIPEQAAVFEPGGLRAWFADARPSFAHMTPPLGRLLAAPVAGAPMLAGLKRIFWGGDLLTPALIAEVDAIAPGVAHTNFYGSTETPQAAGFFDFDGDMTWKNVPVGKGSDGFQLAIVDRARRQKGVAEVGEIAVRSNLLALGYVQDGIVEPRADTARPDLYYTGDRGFHLPTGDVVVLGRNDDQIKIRGYRVDLGEVSAALARHPNVAQAIALAQGEEEAKRIVAFTVDDLAPADRRRTLLSFLSERLPLYMLPQSIRHVDALPLLPNGKVDRKALLALPEEAAAPAPVGRASPAETALIADWSAILGRRDIGRDTSFVSLGGDSLSFVQVFLATEKALGTVPDGWQFMSVAELAATKREARRWLSVIDTAMLVRALAILFVVAGHFDLIDYAGGATSALFLVSGFLLGGLQLFDVLRRRSAQPVFDLLVRVTVPVALFCVLLFVVKEIDGQDERLTLLTFTLNFVDYARYRPPDWGGHEFYLWYIHCALQIFLLTGAAVWAAGRATHWQLDRWRLALGLFGLACGLRFLAPALFIPGWLADGATPLAMVNFLPTTHWATLLLGVVVAAADTQPRKLLAAGLVALYALATHVVFWTSGWMFLLAFGLMLLWLHRVLVPKLLARAVFALSGASLFIYLTHFQWRVIFRWLDLPESPALQVAGALAGGIAAWALWQRLWSWLVLRRRREELSPIDATP